MACKGLRAKGVVLIQSVSKHTGIPAVWNGMRVDIPSLPRHLSLALLMGEVSLTGVLGTGTGIAVLCACAPKSFKEDATTRKPELHPSQAVMPQTLCNAGSLRGSSVKIGTMQRRLAWPLHKSRSVNNLYPFYVQNPLQRP